MKMKILAVMIIATLGISFQVYAKCPEGCPSCKISVTIIGTGNTFCESGGTNFWTRCAAGNKYNADIPFGEKQAIDPNMVIAQIKMEGQYDKNTYSVRFNDQANPWPKNCAQNSNPQVCNLTLDIRNQADQLISTGHLEGINTIFNITKNPA